MVCHSGVTHTNGPPTNPGHFKKARVQLRAGRTKRAGLLATQGIRGGRNRQVLERIKEGGDIFFAVSDRDWVLEGANVHVSMVGFDNGGETERTLDGVRVERINTNLTATTDTTTAHEIPANAGICIIGTQKNGAFDIPFELAMDWLNRPLNPNGRPNSDVLLPWSNGSDVTQRSSDRWIIDFGVVMPESEATFYEAPIQYLREHVRPKRLKNRREAYRVRWWLHAEPRRAMREAIAGLRRFAATPALSKHRTFVWLSRPILADKQLAVFARDDDFFFGVLHSRVHEVWTRAMATQLREVESGLRYTPTSCFETFPLPEVAAADQRERIATAAARLDELRRRWLTPSDLTSEECYAFRAAVDGPWGPFVVDATGDGIGTTRFYRKVPLDEEADKALQKRTLTDLYNEPPEWLNEAHRALDEAVVAGYGWGSGISDSEIIQNLLALNRQRSGELLTI